MSNRKHKWKGTYGTTGHMTQRCIVCGEFDYVHADPIDSEYVVEELNRIHKRKDCPGRKK